MTKTGCVYLVGAGCGSADLITLRGLRLLQSCDAVVYDALIDPELLKAASRAELYPAGKRGGRQSMPQEEINEMLVRLASEGKRVVRLKGGDPYVFGRGGEEVLALRAADIPFEEVPGISSSVAIPAEAGIPVTHRELSRSFHVITGHTTVAGMPEDIGALAALRGTLVFLMGLGALEQIADGLMAAGKPGSTPAAVVSGGNAPRHFAVRGTLETIASKTREAGVQPPAVIVVGETAALDFSATLKKPLDGVRVRLMGTDAFTEKLALPLRELGAAVSWAMTAEIRPLPLGFDLRQLREGRPRWVVLTSGNGVRCFFERLAEADVDLRSLCHCKFAAIGPATRKALAQHGILADLCPGRATGADLGKALCEAVAPGEEVLLFRAAGSDAALRLALEEKAIPAREFALYETVFTPTGETGAADYLTFASAGGVRSYFEDCGAPEPGTTCVCIGPVTAAELRKHTDAPFLTAPEILAEGIVQCILDNEQKRKMES